MNSLTKAISSRAKPILARSRQFDGEAVSPVTQFDWEAYPWVLETVELTYTDTLRGTKTHYGIQDYSPARLKASALGHLVLGHACLPAVA